MKKLKNIMQGADIKNTAHRSGFDLSHKKAFTAKLGELLPIHVEDVAPGEYHRIATSLFTRTQPCETAAFCRFKEHIDWFFVPYHLLWRYYNNFIVQTDANEWSTDPGQSSINSKPLFSHHPYFTANNLETSLAHIEALEDKKVNPLGYNRKALSYKLFEYLGYGDLTQINDQATGDIARNIFPLLAYQKVYNDYYRNQQWEIPSPHTYNIDFISDSAHLQVNMDNGEDYPYPQMFDLRYVDYEKDYFTGCLPSKQYGDTALARPIVGQYINMSTSVGGDKNQINDIATPVITDTSIEKPNWSSDDIAVIGDLGLDYLGIRKAEALQKFREIQQSGRTDYKSQVQKHFNVNVHDELSHLSTWLGGTTRGFGLDEVVNQNIGQGSAVIRGKGVNFTDDFLEFRAPEHGILICLYHVSLLPDYRASLCVDRLTLKTQPGDYIIPEMDSIGMQPLYQAESDVRIGFEVSSVLEENRPDNVPIVGYVPRYAEYKTKPDVVCGAFNSTLKNWVTPRSPLGLLQDSGYQFVQTGQSFYPDGSQQKGFNQLETNFTATRLKINPNILDNIFGVKADSSVNTDQFLVNCNFAWTAVRPLSINGLPF